MSTPRSGDEQLSDQADPDDGSQDAEAEEDDVAGDDAAEGGDVEGDDAAEGDDVEGDDAAEEDDVEGDDAAEEDDVEGDDAAEEDDVEGDDAAEEDEVAGDDVAEGDDDAAEGDDDAAEGDELEVDDDAVDLTLGWRATAVQEARSRTREFVEGTSLYGVRSIADSNTPKLKRLLMLVGTVMIAVLCAMEVKKLYERWQNSPIMAALSPNPTKVVSIPFPAVTICPENRIRMSLFNVEENFDKALQQLGGTDQFASADEQHLVEAVAMVCETNPALPTNFNPGPLHRRALHQVSSRVEDVFDVCKFQGKEFNCASLFRPLITSIGICFTYNMLYDHEMYTQVIDRNEVCIGVKDSFNSSWDHEFGYVEHTPPEAVEYPFREIEFTGSGSGLQLLLKTDLSDLQQVCSDQSVENFRLILHAPSELPSPQGNFLPVTPGGQLMVTLKPETISPGPELKPAGYSAAKRGCRFPDENNLFFLTNYTKQNCMTDKAAQLLLKNCICSPFYLPLKGGDNNTVASCSKSAVEECSTLSNGSAAASDGASEEVDENDECLPSCFELKFGYQVSTSKLALDKARKNISERKMKFTSLVIFFEGDTFNGLVISEVYGLTDFLASSGAILALFMGFSAASIVQLVKLLTGFVIKLVRYFLAVLRVKITAAFTAIRASLRARCRFCRGGDVEAAPP